MHLDNWVEFTTYLGNRYVCINVPYFVPLNSFTLISRHTATWTHHGEHPNERIKLTSTLSSKGLYNIYGALSLSCGTAHDINKWSDDPSQNPQWAPRRNIKIFGWGKKIIA